MSAFKLNTFVSILIVILISFGYCEAFENIDIELEHDDRYPQLIRISDFHYRAVDGKAVEISAVVDIREEIATGTKVNKIVFL